MPGLKWPHQPRPRHVESIADDQVKIWSFKQDRHKDVALENGLEGGIRSTTPSFCAKTTFSRTLKLVNNAG